MCVVLRCFAYSAVQVKRKKKDKIFIATQISYTCLDETMYRSFSFLHMMVLTVKTTKILLFLGFVTGKMVGISKKSKEIFIDLRKHTRRDTENERGENPPK